MGRVASAVVIATGVFLFASIPIAAEAKFSTDPPPGIAATTRSLPDILAAYHKARGKPVDPNASYVEEDSYVTGGVSGTTRYVSIGDDYLQIDKEGPFTTMSGSRDGVEWNSNENGIVTRVQGIHQRGAVDQRALAEALTKPSNEVRLLGEVSSPVSAYVVEVDPTDGRLEWYFFDTANGLLDRTETIFPASRVVETFSDFRTHDGITDPWSGTHSDGNPDNDESWKTTSEKYGAQIDPSTLDIPASRQLVEFPAGQASAKLPIRIIDGDIILTITVDGKNYDFLVDSGSGDIAVDYSAAKQMGLTLVGQHTAIMASQFQMSRAVIAEADAGPLKMHNVEVSVIPHTQQINESIELVGLVGYDFIASMELRIDYDDASGEALAPGSYVPPDTTFVVPVALDDYVPLVPAQIGSAIGDNFLIDTGAFAGFVFPRFAAAHKADISDEGGGRQLQEDIPFMEAQGVGGAISIVPKEVRSFNVGGVNFNDFIIYTMPGAGATYENEDYDGIIGYDFLKYFNLVFDYRDSMIYLEPNNLYKRSVTR
jgi:hypothetical protein